MTEPKSDPPKPEDPFVAKIRRFVADTFCDGRATGLLPETGLVTSGIVDSAGIVHVVEFLERTFAIVIDDADVGLETFNTLTALAALVRSKRPGGLAPSARCAAER